MMILTYSIGDKVDYTKLHWQSDWNGYEVGFENIGVVGLYTNPNTNEDYYIDMESSKILQIFSEEEEEY